MLAPTAVGADGVLTAVVLGVTAPDGREATLLPIKLVAVTVKE
jgi:hypothetical protein